MTTLLRTLQRILAANVLWYTMKTIKLSILLILLSWTNLQAQDPSLVNIKIDRVLVDNGKYKDYYKYEIENYILYNGRHKNNLKYEILDKVTNEIVLSKDNSQSDAMILKPKFFETSDKSIKVLLIEVTAEYSWGQEIVLIKEKNVKYIGYLDYAVDIENGLSIADYCKLTYENGKVIMTFKDVPLVYWPEDKNIINGKDLRFEFDLMELRNENKVRPTTGCYFLWG